MILMAQHVFERSLATTDDLLNPYFTHLVDGITTTYRLVPRHRLRLQQALTTRVQRSCAWTNTRS